MADAYTRNATLGEPGGSRAEQHGGISDADLRRGDNDGYRTYDSIIPADAPSASRPPRIVNAGCAGSDLVLNASILLHRR